IDKSACLCVLSEAESGDSHTRSKGSPMTAIDISELQERARRAQEALFQFYLETMPGLLHEAARNGKPCAIVMRFFVASNLEPRGFAGKLADLPRGVRLLHDHLKETGLNPGFFECRCRGAGNLPHHQEEVQGRWYQLNANWQSAPEDNALRRVYE